MCCADDGLFALVLGFFFFFWGSFVFSSLLFFSFPMEDYEWHDGKVSSHV